MAFMLVPMNKMSFCTFNIYKHSTHIHLICTHAIVFSSYLVVAVVIVVVALLSHRIGGVFVHIFFFGNRTKYRI